MRRLSVPGRIGVVTLAFVAFTAALMTAAMVAGPDGWGRPLLMLVSYPCN